MRRDKVPDPDAGVSASSPAAAAGRSLGPGAPLRVSTPRPGLSSPPVPPTGIPMGLFVRGLCFWGEDSTSLGRPKARLHYQRPRSGTRACLHPRTRRTKSVPAAGAPGTPKVVFVGVSNPGPGRTLRRPSCRVFWRNHDPTQGIAPGQTNVGNAVTASPIYAVWARASSRRARAVAQDVFPGELAEAGYVENHDPRFVASRPPLLKLRGGLTHPAIPAQEPGLVTGGIGGIGRYHRRELFGDRSDRNSGPVGPGSAQLKPRSAREGGRK